MPHVATLCILLFLNYLRCEIRRALRHGSRLFKCSSQYVNRVNYIAEHTGITFWLPFVANKAWRQRWSKPQTDADVEWATRSDEPSVFHVNNQRLLGYVFTWRYRPATALASLILSRIMTYCSSFDWCICCENLLTHQLSVKVLNCSTQAKLSTAYTRNLYWLRGY